MYYVYILLSKKDGKLYIGFAPDLNRRLEKHHRGFVQATKYRRPLQLIHYEVYMSIRDAKRREVFLKGGRGHEEMKMQFADTFRKLKYQFI